MRINNSICMECKKRLYCPAVDSDVIYDDITGCVIECDLYDKREVD